MNLMEEVCAPLKKINVFVASRFENKNSARKNIEEVVSRMADYPVCVVSSWLYGAEDYDPLEHGSIDKAFGRFSENDLHDIDDCDLFVLDATVSFDGATGGAYTEMGYAIAKEIPVVVIGNGSERNLYHWNKKVVRIPSYKYLDPIIKNVLKSK